MKTKFNIIFMSVTFSFLVTLTGQNLFAQSQFYLSEVWDMDGGETPIFYKNASTTDVMRNVYVVGSTTNTGSGNDILVQKFNRDGELLWEQSYDGGANLQDMGTDVFVDNQMNVYVTGAATQNAQNNLDLVVLKYNSNGVLLWTYFYNFGGLPIPYDGGTAITGDNSGGIYVTGTSAGSNTMMDYITIKLNANNGSQIWSNRYDFTQLDEVPNKIRFAGNHVFVTGASQVSLTPNKWELATVFYNSTNGVFSGERRSGGSSTEGLNEANDLTIDNQGNIYVLGATKNQGTDYDISLFKLNDDLDLVWEQHFDGYGGDDRGFGVKTDNAGIIYAVGYVSNPNQGKNYSILKYDSNGTLLWSREYNGLANLDDEAVQLVVRGDRIFVTGAARNNGNSQITTMGYTSNGKIFSVKSFDSPFQLNDKPTALGIDLDDNLIVIAQLQVPGGAFKNITVKYNIHEKLITPVYIDSVPTYNQRELIVRFDKSTMNLDAVDKKNFDAGLLKDFVKPYVIDSLNSKFPFDAGRLETFKIFPRMTTADSLSITRLGDTIPVPAFWATLSVMLPDEFDLSQAKDSLATLWPLVNFSELNRFIFLYDVPNDEFIGSQANLIPNVFFPNAHINVQNAWDIEVGQSHTKVGVYDSPIYWAHEDFGDGTYPGSKIAGGWDFASNHHISLVSDDIHPHGTQAAGIIGALRNNGVGIAGIAGGDVENNNTGVQLFSMGIMDNTILTGITTTINAIVEGSLQTTNGFGYGLHIQNHSWGLDADDESILLKSGVETAWRNHCIFVAARGNFGDELLTYPSCFDDRMVINVGASGTNGRHMYGNHLNFQWNNGNFYRSSFGGGIDLIAPGTTQVIMTTAIPDIEPILFCENPGLPVYQCFTGTSASAPHVSGVAALMHSKHHVNAGAPNNLATEDVEYILQKTAFDVQNDDLTEGPPYPTGYDIWNGWGLLNATPALEAVNFPSFYVKHSGQAAPSSVPSYGHQVTIMNTSNTNLATGIYNADRYQLNWTYIDVLPPGHEIVDWWPLEASTYSGVSGAQPITGEPYMQVSPSVSFGTNTAVFSVMTFAWWVKTTQAGGTINKWIPSGGPSSLRYAYSLHVNDNTVGGSINNSVNTNPLIYPNPADETIQLDFSNFNIGTIKLEIYDIQGRIVSDANFEILESTINSVSLNIGKLKSGLYTLKLISGDVVITNKFVKL